MFASLLSIAEYRSWDPCRGQINALDRVQQKAARLTNHTKDSDWETLAERRAIGRLCVLFTVCCGERLGKLYVTETELAIARVS